MSTTSAEQAVHSYARAYEQIYRRAPYELRALSNDWVVVNGARMRATDLMYLTSQLQQEHIHAVKQRRNVVTRLLKWFSS